MSWEKMNGRQKEWWDKREHLTWQDWFKISRYKILSEEFINLAADKLDWHVVCSEQYLSEQIIEKHIDKIKWYAICYNQKLSEDFIRRHWDDVSTELINLLRGQNLNMSFLREIALLLNDDKWDELSWHQELNVDFLREFKDSIQWKRIHDRFAYPIKHEFYQQMKAAGAL